MIGSSHSITWIDNLGLAAIKIESSVNGGSTWQTVAASAPNTGSYNWTVPNSPSATCRIRVSDAADGNPADQSDADFTISASSLVLSAPNGGENWYTGDVQNITWTTVGSIPNVKLEFSTNNGSSWQTIVASVANSGSYGWTIPATPSASCLVRITDAADANRSDVSNAVFRISTQFLTVTSPNGGQTLILGATENLTWNTGGPTANVKIELSRNGGTNWEVLTSSTANIGTYPWLVFGASSANCLLRVSDAADGDPVDVSDAIFSVAALSLTLTAPNGGEKWSYNTSHAIEWTTNGAIDGVRLEYSINNGSSWSLIVANTPNSGIYNWAVPNNLSTTCRVRVSDSGDGVPTDMSDNVFSIVTPNRVPVAVIGGGPFSAPRGVPITFNASQSTDPDGDPLTYAWEFGDGQFGSGVQVSHTYVTAQKFSVTLTVSDDRGGDAFAFVDASVYNRPPVANSGGSYNVKPGNAIDFNASASTDPDGDGLAFLWDFGDGTTLTAGAQISHLYADLGTYRVILRVDDDLGATDYDTTRAIVSNNLYPVVDIRASEVTVLGSCADTYEIDFFIEEAQDPDGSIASYLWDFGDGHSSSSNTGVSHTFDVPGAFKVKLRVVDNEGAESSDSLQIVLTADHAPVAAINVEDDTVQVNTTVIFDASTSSDADGGIVTYVWNFGDGNVVTGSQPTTSHVFQNLGVFNVLLTVSDGCGKIGTTAQTMHVLQFVGVDDGRLGGAPEGFELAQSYPNPISLNGLQAPATRIAFHLPRAAGVELAVYNIFGQQVRALARSYLAPGNHAVNWDLRDDRGDRVSTGIYFYRLKAGSMIATKRLVVTK